MKTPSKKLCAITITMKVNLWNGKIAASLKMEKSQTQGRKVQQNGEKSNTGEKSSLKMEKSQTQGRKVKHRGEKFSQVEERNIARIANAINIRSQKISKTK